MATKTEELYRDATVDVERAKQARANAVDRLDMAEALLKRAMAAERKAKKAFLKEVAGGR